MHDVAVSPRTRSSDPIRAAPWESAEAYERFMRERLGPIFAEAGMPPLDTPPMLEVHRVFVASALSSCIPHFGATSLLPRTGPRAGIAILSAGTPTFPRKHAVIPR